MNTTEGKAMPVTDKPSAPGRGASLAPGGLVSPTTIDRAQLRLKKVRRKEVREPVSVQDALQLLRPQIVRLVRLGYQLKEIAEFLADDGKGGGIEVDAQALADVVAAGRLGTRSKAGLPVPITGNMPEL